MTPDQGTVPRRSLTRVWAHPGYRGVLISLVLSGIAVSSYVPLLSLYLVQTLRASDSTVGLFTLTSLASPVVGILLGRWSDRLTSRLRLLVVVSAWLALGRVAMGLAPSFGVAVAVGIVFGAFTGITGAQVFALLRELLEREGEPQQATITSTIRSGYSLGWALGPVLGSLLADGLGYRAALAASGLLVLLPLLPLCHPAVRVRPPGSSNDRSSPRRRADQPDNAVRRQDRSWGARSLWLFAVVCLLALTGEALRLTYLPLLAVDRLGVPLWLFGLLVSLAPVIELGAMPAAGMLADRLGLRPVIFVGLIVGAGGFAAFATSTGFLGLLVGQVCNACFIAVLLGVGVTYAQRLHPGGVGFAASVFFAAQSLSLVSSGLLGGALADRSGLLVLFLTAVVLAAAAAVLLLFTRPPMVAQLDLPGSLDAPGDHEG